MPDAGSLGRESGVPPQQKETVRPPKSSEALPDTSPSQWWKRVSQAARKLSLLRKIRRAGQGGMAELAGQHHPDSLTAQRPEGTKKEPFSEEGDIRAGLRLHEFYDPDDPEHEDAEGREYARAALQQADTVAFFMNGHWGVFSHRDPDTGQDVKDATESEGTTIGDAVITTAYLQGVVRALDAVGNTQARVKVFVSPQQQELFATLGQLDPRITVLPTEAHLNGNDNMSTVLGEDGGRKVLALDFRTAQDVDGRDTLAWATNEMTSDQVKVLMLTDLIPGAASFTQNRLGYARYGEYIRRVFNLTQDEFGRDFFPQPRLPLPEGTDAIYQQVLRENGISDISSDTLQIGLIPQANVNYPAKAYPLDAWKTSLELIAQQLQMQQPDEDVVLNVIFDTLSTFPGLQEADLRQAFTDMFRQIHPRFRVNFIATALKNLPSVMAHQQLLLSTDTGAKHIAEAVGTEAVVVYNGNSTYKAELWSTNARLETSLQGEREEISPTAISEAALGRLSPYLALKDIARREQREPQPTDQIRIASFDSNRQELQRLVSLGIPESALRSGVIQRQELVTRGLVFHNSMRGVPLLTGTITLDGQSIDLSQRRFLTQRELDMVMQQDNIGQFDRRAVSEDMLRFEQASSEILSQDIPLLFVHESIRMAKLMDGMRMGVFKYGEYDRFFQRVQKLDGRGMGRLLGTTFLGLGMPRVRGISVKRGSDDSFPEEGEYSPLLTSGFQFSRKTFPINNLVVTINGQQKILNPMLLYMMQKGIPVTNPALVTTADYVQQVFGRQWGADTEQLQPEDMKVVVQRLRKQADDWGVKPIR